MAGRRGDDEVRRIAAFDGRRHLHGRSGHTPLGGARHTRRQVRRRRARLAPGGRAQHILSDRLPPKLPADPGAALAIGPRRPARSAGDIAPSHAAQDTKTNLEIWPTELLISLSVNFFLPKFISFRAFKTLPRLATDRI